MNLKKLGIIALSIAMAIGGYKFADANSEVFTVSATVPGATGGSFAVSKVTAGVFTSQASNNLAFGTLTFDATNNIFVSAYYFAIDIAGTGGAGFPNISIAYADTGSPTGAVAGLGDRGTLSYSKMTQSGGVDTETAIDGMSLGEANNLTISPSAVAGGWLRINIGIATGDPSLSEGSAVPFTAADAPGAYTGTVTITATGV